MKKNIVLMVLLLCTALIFCACSHNNTDTDRLSEEDRIRIEELTEEAASSSLSAKQLEKYYEIIQLDPKNINTRLNIAECHIALENYDLALQALDFVIKFDPANQKLSELYLQLSNKTGDPSYAYTAIELAERNHNEEFLSLRPEAPGIKLKPGHYDERVSFELLSDGSSGDVYVTVENDGDLSYDFTMQYTGPIALLRGTNTVSVYAMSNGIPSETVTVQYHVDYAPTEVSFKEAPIEKLVRLVLNKPSGPITDVDCERIEHLSWKNLRSTVSNDAAYKNIKIQSLEDLKHFPRLMRLDLEYQNGIADYAPLASCPLIAALYVENCYLSSARFIEYTPNLTHLSLYNYTADWNVYMEGINTLATRRNLQYLDTRGNNLGSVTTINEFTIRTTRQTMDKVVQNNPELTTLYMNSEHLSNWTVLLDLSISDFCIWGIRDANYSIISRMTTLEDLYIWHGFREYWADTPAKSLSYLKSLPNIKKLALGGVDSVSDLKYIHELEKLEYLRLAENSDVVSDSTAMAELQKALPNCQIVLQ